MQAEKWEAMTVTCCVGSTHKKLKIMSFRAFALHMQEVQSVPYEFWEILRSVIGAGVDGFVYHPALVSTPTRAAGNRKVTTSRGGKSPRKQPLLRGRVEQDEEVKDQSKQEEPAPAPSSEEEEKAVDGKRTKVKKVYEYKYAQPILQRHSVSIVYR